MTTETLIDGNAAAVAANGREARNLAEKQRRDKLNASIQELATMVPHVAESTRRLDKTAVLRFATHGLRLQYVFGKSASRRRRKFCSKDGSGLLNGCMNGNNNNGSRVDSPLLTDTLMQLLDSFFVTLTCNGQILLISSSVEHLLGHCQSDLYGQNILQITHPEDQALFRQQLIPRDIETLFYHQQQSTTSASGSDGDGDLDDGMELDQEEDDGEGNEQKLNHLAYRTPSPRTLDHLDTIDKRLRADRRCFTVRLARASTRAEATRHYEVVKIDGCFRRSDSSVTGGTAANYPIVSQLIRRSRSNGLLAAAAASVAGATGTTATSCLPQHDAIAQAALHGISGNDIVLVAMARIVREETTLLCRQPEPYQLEYRTRHLIDGSIIDCDQRIGLVAGYMKDEVRNLSPFSFMHQDDVRWVIVALRQMYDCNSDYGESCYRLLSRNGHFIYLQTKGFLDIDKSTNKVHSFLCVNTLLDEEVGKRKVQEMKNKFSTIIKAKIPTNTSPDLPASRNPQQLERIVLYLIENLQKSSGGDGGGIQSVDSLDDGYCSPASTATTLTLEELAPSPTPTSTLQQPLALVPPAPSSVKHSISKSVSVVNVTAARYLQYQQQQQVPHQSMRSPPSDDGNSPSPAAVATPSPPVRVSVLRKLSSDSGASGAADDAQAQSPAPIKLQAALSNTLRTLDSQLTTQGQEAQTLYQQPVLLPKFERRMDAIMEEHQKQQQLLVNIKSEYDVHVQQPMLLSLPQPQPQPQPQPSTPVSVITITTTPQTTIATTGTGNSNAVASIGSTCNNARSQQRRAL
ncbi:aryl hydrocarbon receptor nuclear translocator-like protein 1 [Scaptodrosophila lebanonensis]|uniref:Aryl hydrocarbon receptor nuclear translocator-like protein 1 n=1 Tax=Drosophila lebanonensis TaxID=7225 RepID=A0A6J2TP00_DROLE|nr:aryl hydrocarbon receptor nuclear translocator-like protein 1 [Scaptodrosophila lebanonensis]